MADNNVDLNVRVNMRDNTQRQLKSFESSVIRTVGAISAAFASLSAIVFPVTQAARFERSMADVAKTTGFADEDIKRLSASLVDMSKVLGTTSQDLAAVAATAGQLGLGDQGRKSIEAFTESVARASVTLGLSVDKIAEGGAQLSAIFGKSVGEVEKVFSTINELSNNSVAAGGDLIDIMKRVGTTSGATLQEVAALAATMRQLGVPNEQAGTGLVKFLSNLLAESKKFSKAMGLTQNEWVDKVKDNSVDALKFVLTELSSLGSAQQAALTKSLFGSGRLFAAATKLVGDASNNYAVLNRMLALSADGFREGTSSIDEYNRIMDTTVQQLQVLKASFVGLGIGAGDRALPAIQEAIESLSNTLQSDEVVAYFEELGEGIGSVVDGVTDAVRWVASLDIEWTNVINTLKLLLQLSVLKYFTRLSLALGGKLLNAINLVSVAFSRFSVRAVGFFTTVGNLGVRAAVAATGVGTLATAVGVLGRVVAAALGPVGLLWALAATVVYHWREEIGSFLGYVDAETKQRERAIRLAERDARKKKAEAIADAEEFTKRIKFLFDDRGDVLGKDREVSYELTLDTEAAQQDLKSMADTFTLLSNTVNSAKSAIELNQDSLDGWQTEADSVATKMSELEKSIGTFKNAQLSAARSGITLDDSVLKDWEEQLSAAEARLATLSTKLDQGSRAQERYEDSAKKAERGIRELYGPEIARRFDSQTATYARLNAEFKTGTDALKERKAELKKLDEVALRGEGLTAGQADTQARLNDEIARVQDQVDILSNTMGEYKNVMDDGQKATAEFLDGQSTIEANNFAEALDGVQFNQSSAIANNMRVVANETIYNYLKLQQLKDGYGKVSKAANAYAKSAKSALDNTANEIIALNKQIAQFAVDFTTSLADRSIELTLDIKISSLEEDYEKAKAEIEAKYRELEALGKKTQGVVTSGSFSALTGDSNKTKEAALAELELQHTRDVANAKAKSQTEAFNKALDRTVDLLQKAEDAAKSGDLDKALALKSGAKAGIKQAEGLLEEMSQLGTVDVFGKESFKFSDAELDKMLIKIGETGKEMGGGLQDTNKALSDSATAVAEKWKEAATSVKVEFDAVAVIVDKMRTTFGNFDEIMKRAEVSFKESSTTLVNAINVLDTRSDTPFDAAKVLDPTELAADIQEGAEEGLKNFNESVRNSFADGLRDAAGNTGDVVIKFDRDRARAEFGEVYDGVEVKVKPIIDAKAAEPGEVIELSVDLTDEKAIKTLEETRIVFDNVFLKNPKIEGSISGGSTSGVSPIGLAGGGPVWGAGTSTSDSIPAWLSTGEWVMDAFTTKFFGGSFFAGLQAMARGGSRARATKGGLPALAGGGAAPGAESVGSITLNLGGKGYTLYGERKQATELVKLFKNMDRG